jgi:hypothetical protein
MERQVKRNKAFLFVIKILKKYSQLKDTQCCLNVRFLK